MEKVANLGNLGDQVQVRAGYARNYLIPQGKAKNATAENIAEFETRREELQRAAADTLALAETRRTKLEGKEFAVSAKAGGEGKIFGSIGPIDIVQAVKNAGIELEKREVRLPNGPIRQTGEYEIELHLHTDVNVRIKLVVLPEK
jgi:large subunit ribosomal protein L9